MVYFKHVFLRSFHFPEWKTFLYFLWLLFLFLFFFFFFFFVPPLFDMSRRKILSIYRFDIWYIGSVKYRVFGVTPVGPKSFSVRSYLPGTKKHCYHVCSVTVRDIDKLFFFNCSGTQYANSPNLHWWSTINFYRSNLPSEMLKKFKLLNRSS